MTAAPAPGAPGVTPARPTPPTHLRRARAAVSALFFVNGVLYANLVPRLPEVKDHLGLSNAQLGTAIAAMPVGALLAGLLAPLLIRRLGSGRVASYGLLLLAVALAAVPHTGAWVVLAGLLLVAGAVDSVVDVGQNAHGFRVQRAYGRSIVNAFHGLWSIGAVTGGALGSLAIAARVPLTTHLAVAGAAFSVVALVAHRFTLPGPEDAERVAAAPSEAVVSPAPRRRRPLPRATVLPLAALSVLAVCGAFVEDAGSSWGALYLGGEVGAEPAVAGLAFVALMVAMTIGRLTGDRVVDRFGQRAVALTGGAAIAAGMGAALAWPSLPTTLVGFALAGLGVATLVPAVMHTADELPGLPHGVGLSIVSWTLRIGFLVSPTLVGVVADAASLRVALLGVVLAGLGVLAFGRVLVPGDTAVPGEPVDAGAPSGPGGPPSAAPSAPLR